jgi:hypothetical protein
MEVSCHHFHSHWSRRSVPKVKSLLMVRISDFLPSSLKILYETIHAFLAGLLKIRTYGRFLLLLLLDCHSIISYVKEEATEGDATALMIFVMTELSYTFTLIS